MLREFKNLPIVFLMKSRGKGAMRGCGAISVRLEVCPSSEEGQFGQQLDGITPCAHLHSFYFCQGSS